MVRSFSFSMSQLPVCTFRTSVTAIPTKASSFDVITTLTVDRKVGFVPRTCPPSVGIDTLLSCVLIRDVTMGIPWATAPCSGRMHHSDGVNLPICSPSATRKGCSRSVPYSVEHRDRSCCTFWHRKGRPTRCDNKIRCARNAMLSPLSLLRMRLYRRHKHSKITADAPPSGGKALVPGSGIDKAL